ncbi:MAG TPA: hypothetical protein VGM33_02690 [Baekduia sp.]
MTAPVRSGAPASVLCAAAGDIALLNSARALQGVGGAIMFAVSLALLANAFPDLKERARALAAWARSRCPRRPRPWTTSGWSSRRPERSAEAPGARSRAGSRARRYGPTHTPGMNSVPE